MNYSILNFSNLNFKQEGRALTLQSGGKSLFNDLLQVVNPVEQASVTMDNIMKILVENDDGTEAHILSSPVADPKATTGMFNTNDFERDVGSVKY